jgi:hypothetical protein
MWGPFCLFEDPPFLWVCRHFCRLCHKQGSPVPPSPPPAYPIELCIFTYIFGYNCIMALRWSKIPLWTVAESTEKHGVCTGPYARVDLNPILESTLSPSQRLWILPQVTFALHRSTCIIVDYMYSIVYFFWAPPTTHTSCGKKRNKNI